MSGGKARKAGWGLMAASAVVVGAFSLRYALPTVPHPVLTNFVTHRTALCIHAVSASIALLIGPWQFLARLRRSRPRVHRVLGRVYAGAVLIGWIGSVPVGLHAETGAVASAGFLTLGVLWIACTAAGVATILRSDVAAHRHWMIRSYALTAAAITLRIYLPVATGLHLPFATAYPAIAWLCWVPNILVTEAVLRLAATRDALARPALPGGARNLRLPKAGSSVGPTHR